MTRKRLRRRLALLEACLRYMARQLEVIEDAALAAATERSQAIEELAARVTTLERRPRSYPFW